MATTPWWVSAEPSCRVDKNKGIFYSSSFSESDTPSFNTFISHRLAPPADRVAIARALVKRPRVLILDEATSALDNASETIVQAAIDHLMSSRDQTCIVIAHRLSTIRNADKIVFISNGKVLEQGPHDELIAKPNGRYKRLVDSSKRDTTVTSEKLKDIQMSNKKSLEDDEEEKEIDWEAKFEDEEDKAFNEKRARQMASREKGYMAVGSIGAVMAGSMFPMWGVLFSETISLLFRVVVKCPSADGTLPPGFETCEEYWQYSADDMQEESFVVSVYWAILLASCLLGFTLNFWGFGMASERLNRRVRDLAFSSLMRQEVAFFGKTISAPFPFCL